MSDTLNSGPSKPSPVVVDARVDETKLRELLGHAAEYPELDFKQTMDLGKKSIKDNLDFVKDALSMSNSTHGGYLIIGATGDGTPAHGSEPINPAHFDSAILKDKVSTYVADHVSIVSKIHMVEDRNIALIYVAPPSDGIPHMTVQEGRYDRGIIIRKGTIYTRQGTQNVIASSNDLRRLLTPFRTAAFEEGRSHVDDLIRTLTQTLAGTAGGVPMLIDSDMPSFTGALRSNLNFDNEKQIVGFVRSSRRRVAFQVGADARVDRLQVLNKLALVAIETCHQPESEAFSSAIKALEKSYNSTGFANVHSTNIVDSAQIEMTRHFIDVLARVYLIGAAAVREDNFLTVRTTSMVPVRSGTDAYSRYSSWIRHGITYASRANLLSSESDTRTLLAVARQLGHDIPELVSGTSTELTDNDSDNLLNDLTSFDIMWCLAAAASTTTGNETYEMYTSFASVNPRRGESVLTRITTEPEVRKTLAPSASDTDFARALDHVLELARSESHSYNTFWSRAKDIPAVSEFINNYKDNT